MKKIREYCVRKNLREMDPEYLLMYRICIVLLPFVLAVTILFIICGNTLSNLGTQCQFQKLTGLYCIGCGGTRAFNYLVHLHVFKSFYYNPLVPYAYFAYFFYLLNSFLFRHRKKCFEKLSPFVLIYIALGIITVTFAVRNLILFFTGVHLI